MQLEAGVPGLRVVDLIRLQIGSISAAEDQAIAAAGVVQRAQ